MSSKPTVHVIDDDEAMRESLSFMLDVHGYSARIFDSAIGFVAALPEISPGVILTDIRMPGIESKGGPDKGRQEALRRLADLSPRERDVLNGVVAGKPNKTIAYDLDISPRTVEIYRANLMSKTGARNISELMRIALAAGL